MNKLFNINNFFFNIKVKRCYIINYESDNKKLIIIKNYGFRNIKKLSSERNTI
jgi:hypothetical protein